MPKTPEELLALKFGDATVAENIRSAVETGVLIEDADGGLRLAEPRKASTNWARVNKGLRLECEFLIYFLFPHVYAKTAVPMGCSACYKVKVVPRTLRELVAAWGVGKGIECRSKWGVDLTNPYSQNVYAGYFYTAGLEGARATYRVVREIIDRHPLLGPDVGMTIKRGCSEYEAVLGPSNEYTFAPELTELESYLKTKFHTSKSNEVLPVPMANWINTAFCIGDDTYLDFTQGRRLRPKTMTYEP